MSEFWWLGIWASRSWPESCLWNSGIAGFWCWPLGANSTPSRSWFHRPFCFYTPTVPGHPDGPRGIDCSEGPWSVCFAPGSSPFRCTVWRWDTDSAGIWGRPESFWWGQSAWTSRCASSASSRRPQALLQRSPFWRWWVWDHSTWSSAVTSLQIIHPKYEQSTHFQYCWLESI